MKISSLAHGSSDPSVVIRETVLLAPWFQMRLEAFLADARLKDLGLHVFETTRSPARQDWLYDQGRSRPGKRVTRSRAWESWHQYGVAVDLAFFHDRRWSWEGPWDLVIDVVNDYGFETLSFEKAHIQISAGFSTAEAKTITKSQGIIALWDLMERRLSLYSES